MLYAVAIICCAVAILLSAAGLYLGPSSLYAFALFVAGLGLGAQPFGYNPSAPGQRAHRA